MERTYNKNKLIALCSVVYFASYLCRKDFAVAMAGMLDAGVFGSGEGALPLAGLVGTALFAAYGLGQIISGFLGDRMSPKRMILIGLLTSAACNAAMPLLTNPVLMIPVWAVNGLAQAMLWPPIVRILSENLSHEHYVLGNAMVTCAAHSATMILYLFVPLCLRLFNWQTVFFVATALAMVVFLIFLFGLRRVLPAHPESVATILPKKNEKKQGYFSLLASCGVLPLLLSVALQGYLRDGIDSWLPTLFTELFEIEAADSTLLSVVLPIFAMFSMFLSLRLHRRLLKNEALGTGVLFSFATLFAVILYFLIGTKGTFAGILTLLLAALITTCAHCCNFFLISCLPGHFARFGRAATTSGFCNAFTYLGSAASSYGIALIAEHFDWKANVLSWALLSAIGVLCSVFAFRRYTRFFRESENIEKQEERETASATR